MSKRPSTFRKTDIKRLVEAAAMAGLEVGTIRISKAGDLELTPMRVGVSCSTTGSGSKKGGAASETQVLSEVAKS
jgi:hypothetical protein